MAVYKSSGKNALPIHRTIPFKCYNLLPVSRLEASMDKPKDPELRDCVVRLRDDHEVEHCVKLRAASVYEAALRGLARLEKVG